MVTNKRYYRRRLFHLSILLFPYSSQSWLLPLRNNRQRVVLALQREESDVESPRRSRRWFPRLRRQGEKQKKKDGAVQMAVIAEAETSSMITNAFERLSPQDMLPNYTTAIQTKTNNTTTRELTNHHREQQETNENDRCRWLENRLCELINSWCTATPPQLNVRVWPKAKYVTGQVVHEDDVDISVEHAVFEPIQFSKLTLRGRRVTTNLLNFFVPQRIRRHPKQFDCYLDDFILTQEDLMESSCIRDGLLRDNLQRLVSQTPMVGDLLTIKSIDSIQVLPGNNLACTGLAGTTAFLTIPFRVQARIDHSSNGHVLSFHDVDISSSLNNHWPIRLVQHFDIDLGATTQLQSLTMDQKRLSLQGKFTITPDRTLKLTHKYHQTTESYSAKCHFDVGRWLTKLGRFND
mmetsp:Transcript_29358/g.44444  ORF Transcript_29358/g.44444 Transcript_29358/m.44444 type:complete len:406 (+) Transcript_29358:255-1472(+)|eukprot:CAMPEP_0178928788 /NCGR_PEP_ID=MMETSP0786-20121207/20142_1 /TAXON_ID=186022 /ORGANISM="Thalassionema frauenfeldii, Strain CCMP 1798" /LENGTH=405 /DNA_ID=CAMNT_0020604779 /DNA_START=205 /DNA_END=1422 /DNA_ORIENTATION=+